uniref:Electron carrier/iron ion-binding protein n=1 Tax=Noccaea caerulescens TaxID=107243 RepID=A0A1J3DH88_NOCCA
MSASSPSLSNNGLSAAVTPPKTLRGLNKPKCIQCGNVARSRCPFQSCKGCCSRAENPCPIHVLKAAATSAEKTQAPSTPSSEQKASEGTPGSTTRVSSIRQLSQINNLNASSRLRKPLSIKDAQALNEWRFAKLKEYKDRNIEVENEAFDRYMSNVNLLEEAFSLTEEEDPEAAASERNDEERLVSELKLRLRSDSARTESFKKRIAETVRAGLMKVKKPGRSDDQDEIKRRIKRSRLEEKTSALSEVIDKVNKARTEEDLKTCVEMKTKLCGHVSSNAAAASSEKKKKLLPGSKREVEISEEALQKIGEQLQSCDEVITL